MIPSAENVVRFDDSDWPIFLVIQPPNALSLDAHRTMLDEGSKRAFARRQPFVLVVDAKACLQRPDALQRKLTAEAMGKGLARQPGILRGMALVLGSALDRHVFTALNLLVRPPYPMAAFETLSKAKAWARQQLSDPKHMAARF